MNTLLLIAALSCPEVHMINTSGEAWTSDDYDNIEAAKIRCGELYSDAPCLVKFVKYDIRSYRATCGAKR